MGISENLAFLHFIIHADSFKVLFGLLIYSSNLRQSFELRSNLFLLSIFRTAFVPVRRLRLGSGPASQERRLLQKQGLKTFQGD